MSWNPTFSTSFSNSLKASFKNEIYSENDTKHVFVSKEIELDPYYVRPFDVKEVIRKESLKKRDLEALASFLKRGGTLDLLSTLHTRNGLIATAGRVPYTVELLGGGKGSIRRINAKIAEELLGAASDNDIKEYVSQENKDNDIAKKLEDLVNVGYHKAFEIKELSAYGSGSYVIKCRILNRVTFIEVAGRLKNIANDIRYGISAIIEEDPESALYSRPPLDLTDLILNLKPTESLIHKFLDDLRKLVSGSKTAIVTISAEAFDILDGGVIGYGEYSADKLLGVLRDCESAGIGLRVFTDKTVLNSHGIAIPVKKLYGVSISSKHGVVGLSAEDYRECFTTDSRTGKPMPKTDMSDLVFCDWTTP